MSSIKNFYEESVVLTMKRCELLLKQASIKGVVTGRTKNEDSLNQELFDLIDEEPDERHECLKKKSQPR